MPPGGRFRRQKSLEEKSVRRQAGDDERGQHGRGARNGGHGQAFGKRRGDKLVTGIGDERRAGIRHKRQRRAIGEPGDEVRPHHRGIMLVIGDKRCRDAVMGEENLRDPRIFRNHGVGRRKRRESAQ